MFRIDTFDTSQFSSTVILSLIIFLYKRNILDKCLFYSANHRFSSSNAQALLVFAIARTTYVFKNVDVRLPSFYTLS